MVFTKRRKQMVNWTCCECEEEFNDFSGEVDERMCYECLDKEPDSAEDYSHMREEVNRLKELTHAIQK